MKKVIACVCVALALLGCSQQLEPGKLEPAKPEPVATEPAKTDGVPVTTVSEFMKAKEVDSPDLTNRVATYLGDQGLLKDSAAEKPILWAVPLGQVPKGYEAMLITFAGESALLFATDAGRTKLEPVARLNGVTVNIAKLLTITSNEQQVKVVSQMPFRATEVHYTFGWDGTNLAVVDHTVTDPTADHYARLEALVQKGDLDGIMQEGGGYLYPDAYEGAYSLPPQILKLAYERSLTLYRAGNLNDALRYLSYGIEQYALKFGLLQTNPSGWGAEYRLPTSDLVPIVNDYAFFLAETGKLSEAEPLLLQVIQAAPGRVVAHLNLADVKWDLGKQAEARPHYRTYLELLGPDQGKAPPRVAERLK